MSTNSSLIYSSYVTSSKYIEKKLNYWMNSNIHYHWCLVAINGEALNEIGKLIQINQIKPNQILAFGLEHLLQAIAAWQNKLAPKIVINWEL